MSDSQQGELVANDIREMLKTSVNGVNELEAFLKETLRPSSNALNTTDHHDENELYLLFKLGNNESIIRIHTSNHPQEIRIWFYDLLGRPAPEIVKKTIASFFKSTFDLDQPPFFDLYLKAKPTVIANTFIINNELLPINKELHAIKKLMQEPICSGEEFACEKEIQHKCANKLGLFQPNKQSQSSDQDTHETKPKSPVKNNT